MSRDPDATRTRRGPLLGGFLVLTAVLSVVSIVAMVRSLAAMTYLNIHFRGEVDLFSRAVSYYVFYGREEFATAVIVLAAGTLTTLLGLRMAGLRLGARAGVFFGVWCTSLTLCAAFPTDNGKSVTSVSGWIHQVAGASLFVSLPLAGLALAKRLVTDVHWSRVARFVRRMSLVAMLPDVFPGLAIPGILDGRGVSGLVQRTLFGLETLMLMALAVHLLRTTVSTARGRREPARTEATG